MAQKNLTRLNVALTATTGAFAKVMGGAVKDATRFGNALKSAIMGPIGLITGGLSAGAFVNAIKNASERIDQLAKSADKLGVATESLAGMRLATEEAGGSAEALETGMAKLQKTVQEATEGNKAATKSINDLGLSVAALSGMSADEQFKAVADAIQNLDTQGKRTAATMEIFGKGGMALANTLALGSKGLNQATEDAQKLGLAVSRVDAFKIEEANDAFGRIGKVIEGIFNNIAIRLSPFITAFAEAFTGASIEAEGFGSTIDRVMDFAVKAGGFVADAWQGLNIIWLAVKQGLYQVGTGFAFLADMGTRAAQWIAAKFSAAFDLIEAAWDVVGQSLVVAWDALKIPIAAFVEYVGVQFASLIRSALEVAGVFSNEMANSMAVAATNIENSVAGMSANAQADLDKTLASLGQASDEVVARTDALFAEVETTGSQTLQDLGAAFWQLAQEQGEALNLALGDERASTRFERIVGEVQSEAQVRAEGRAAELAAKQEQDRAIAEAEAAGLAEREDEISKFYAFTQTEGWKNTQQTVSGASSMFANLSKLQETHSKTAQRIGRASAKAKIVMDTASAAMGAYSAMASIPIIGPALGIAAAAAAVAAGAIQLGNVDKGSVGTSTGGNGPIDTSTGNVGGIATPARNGQTLVLQGESFSAESLVKLFAEAQERGMVIEGVRRG